jgi:hypothetical protein
MKFKFKILSDQNRITEFLPDNYFINHWYKIMRTFGNVACLQTNRIIPTYNTTLGYISSQRGSSRNQAKTTLLQI